MGLALAALAPCASWAQGAVSGQLSIQEKPGETTADLSNAIVYLDPAAGAKAAVHETPTSIAMHDRTFVPHVRVVTVGSAVSFANQDPFRHNIFSNATPGPFDLGLTERGTERANTFKRAGVYSVFCNIHARMAAIVVVVNSPYVTQAGSDGQFTIARVPAGQYTLHVWHERGGEHTQPLDVPADGVAALALQLDARGYRAIPHKNKFGQDYTDASGERY